VSDVRLRQLEREYKTDPTEDSLQRWHKELRRAGVCKGRALIQHYPTYIIAGGQVIEFMLYPECPACKFDPPLCDVSFWWTTTNSAPQQATLTGSDDFNFDISDNTINGVAADGQTPYTVTWGMLEDGLDFGTQHTSWGQVSY